MTHSELYEKNRCKILELRDDVEWAGFQLLDLCWEQEKFFVIIEAYRLQERQDRLIRQGRFSPEDFWVDVRLGKMSNNDAIKGIALLQKYGGIPGAKVTWTISSEHTKGIAIDIVPLFGTSHKDIEPLALQSGITHPWPSDDPPHYSFAKVQQKPVILVLSPAARIKALERAIRRTDSETVRSRLQATLERLQRRI